MKTVDFFFDLSSPYSYLASTQIEAVAARHGAEVRWRPFVLGAVFKATGNVMPATVAAKARWMYADLDRWAKHYGVPFRMTPRFPVNALSGMRLVLVAERAQPGGGRKLAQILFHALWVDDLDITDGAVLRSLSIAAGVDEETGVAGLADPAIKDALRANTDEAVRRGAFGAPAVFYKDELYWGNDRLHFLEAALADDR
jgi:2-hydroxychromene-2-carboxylate isomerase